MRAQRVHRLRRRPGNDGHANVGMGTLERYDDLRQEVRGGDSRRDDRQRTGDPLTEFADAPDGLGEKRLGAEHVIGEELPGRGQLAAPRSPLDQLHPGLPLHVGDVLGDGGLTDAQFPSGRRERPAPRESRERS